MFYSSWKGTLHLRMHTDKSCCQWKTGVQKFSSQRCCLSEQEGMRRWVRHADFIVVSSQKEEKAQERRFWHQPPAFPVTWLQMSGGRLVINAILTNKPPGNLKRSDEGETHNYQVVTEGPHWEERVTKVNIERNSIWGIRVNRADKIFKNKCNK